MEGNDGLDTRSAEKKLHDKRRAMLAMLIGVTAGSIGQALLAQAMQQSNALPGAGLSLLIGILGNPAFHAGLLLMTLFFGLYMLSLRWADLSFVLPLSALSYLLAALLAKFYLGESVTPTRWIGTAVITAGVILVGVGGLRESHSS